MSVTARRIASRGPVKIVVTNGNGFTVSGKLSARTTKGRRLVISGTAFAVSAGARKRVTLTLPGAVRRVLRRERKLRLRLAVKVGDPAGNVRTVTKTVALRR